MALFQEHARRPCVPLAVACCEALIPKSTGQKAFVREGLPEQVFLCKQHVISASVHAQCCFGDVADGDVCTALCQMAHNHSRAIEEGEQLLLLDHVRYLLPLLCCRIHSGWVVCTGVQQHHCTRRRTLCNRQCSLSLLLLHQQQSHATTLVCSSIHATQGTSKSAIMPSKSRPQVSAL